MFSLQLLFSILRVQVTLSEHLIMRITGILCLLYFMSVGRSVVTVRIKDTHSYNDEIKFRKNAFLELLIITFSSGEVKWATLSIQMLVEFTFCFLWPIVKSKSSAKP